MSRITYVDENNKEVVVIINYEECRYKTNGICYNNYDMKLLGKKCIKCERGSKWREMKR